MPRYIYSATSAVAVFLLTGCAFSQKPYNSDNFDLTGWNLSVPVPGKDNPKYAAQVRKLAGYESRYFYDAPDGGMVFKAPVDGRTTRGSKYPRSELREINNGKNAAWKLSEGGTMTATLKVDEVPTTSEGTPGKIVIGQIHATEKELIRLYWDDQNIYFKNEISGPDNKEHEFFVRDKNGKTPQVSLGEKISYKIDARSDTLKVNVYADGHDYISVTKINPAWNSDRFYFKAGVYLGVNESQDASGFAQVSFYGLDYGHTPGSGLGGLKSAR